jgi:hypothetical protein
MPSLDGYSLNEAIKELKQEMYIELSKVHENIQFIYEAIIKEGKNAKSSRCKQASTAKCDKKAKKDESKAKSKVRGKQAS